MDEQVKFNTATSTAPPTLTPTTAPNHSATAVIISSTVAASDATLPGNATAMSGAVTAPLSVFAQRRYLLPDGASGVAVADSASKEKELQREREIEEAKRRFSSEESTYAFQGAASLPQAARRRSLNAFTGVNPLAAMSPAEQTAAMLSGSIVLTNPPALYVSPFESVQPPTPEIQKLRNMAGMEDDHNHDNEPSETEDDDTIFEDLISMSSPTSVTSASRPSQENKNESPPHAFASAVHGGHGVLMSGAFLSLRDDDDETDLPNVDHSIFAAAEAEVMKLMAADSLLRFKQSPLFQEFLERTKEMSEELQAEINKKKEKQALMQQLHVQRSGPAVQESEVRTDKDLPTSSSFSSQASTAHKSRKRASLGGATNVVAIRQKQHSLAQVTAFISSHARRHSYSPPIRGRKTAPNPEAISQQLPQQLLSTATASASSSVAPIENQTTNSGHRHGAAAVSSSLSSRLSFFAPALRRRQVQSQHAGPPPLLRAQTAQEPLSSASVQAVAPVSASASASASAAGMSSNSPVHLLNANRKLSSGVLPARPLSGSALIWAHSSPPSAGPTSGFGGLSVGVALSPSEALNLNSPVHFHRQQQSPSQTSASQHIAAR